MIGRETSPATAWNQTSEDVAWIGKPWRRLALLTQRTFYKGEEIDVARDLTLHLGLRSLGVAVTLSVSKQACLDYSDEQP